MKITDRLHANGESPRKIRESLLVSKSTIQKFVKELHGGISYDN